MTASIPIRLPILFAVAISRWPMCIRHKCALPVIYCADAPVLSVTVPIQKHMSKAKALSALAHKVGRCVYYMLKNQKVFDEKRFLAG